MKPCLREVVGAWNLYQSSTFGFGVRLFDILCLIDQKNEKSCNNIIEYSLCILISETFPKLSSNTFPVTLSRHILYTRNLHHESINLSQPQNNMNTTTRIHNLPRQLPNPQSKTSLLKRRLHLFPSKKSQISTSFR